MAWPVVLLGRLLDRGCECRPCAGGECERPAVAVGGVADEDHVTLADFDAAATVTGRVRALSPYAIHVSRILSIINRDSDTR